MPRIRGHSEFRATAFFAGRIDVRIHTFVETRIGQWSQWWTFREIFGAKYPLLASFGKPIMVAEFGSLAVGGNRTAWYQAALTDLPEKYPSVKALLFFNAKSDQTVTYQKLNWSIAGDAALARTVAAAIKPWAPETAKQPR